MDRKTQVLLKFLQMVALLAQRQRNQPLDRHLQALGTRAAFDALPSFVDCMPYSALSCAVLSESDIMLRAEEDWTEFIAAMAKASKAVVLFERTQLTRPLFSQLQWRLVYACGVNVLPVKSIADAAQTIQRMIKQEAKTGKNFIAGMHGGQRSDSGRAETTHAALIKSVQMFPGIGDVKARALLDRFKSLRGIATASESALMAVLNPASAKRLAAFFREPLHS